MMTVSSICSLICSLLRVLLSSSVSHSAVNVVRDTVFRVLSMRCQQVPVPCVSLCV